MRRRALLAALSASAGVGAPAAAQTPGRTYRLGHLALTEQSERLTRDLALPELGNLGFVVGRNLIFDARIGPREALTGLARELLAARPDVVVAVGGQPARVMHGATRTVPVVVFADDLVELGFAASLARPGGNMTGIANMVVGLQAKRLEMLAEALPGSRRIGALLSVSNPQRSAGEAALRATAARIGVELVIANANQPADYPAAFAALRASGAEALLIGADPQFYADVALLAALAREARLATSCEWADMAGRGCVLGYGPDRAALRRRMASQIASILRGTPPGEVPIEQPTTFEFAVNLRAARAIGVTISPPLLARADEVIE